MGCVSELLRGISVTFFLILTFLLTTANDDLLLFVSSALGVLAQLLLLNCNGHRHNRFWVEQAECVRCLVILSPSLSYLRRIINCSNTLVLDGISMLLGLDLLDLLVVIFINLLWSLLTDLGHLLSHYLSKCVAATCC